MASETTRRPSAVYAGYACFRLFPCVSALPMIRFATTASLRQPPAVERSPIALRNIKQCFQQHPTLQTVPLTTATPPNCASGDSRSFKLCSRRHPRSHTVHSATPAEPYCASGDSRSFKLCSRRHPRSHTVHSATPAEPYCASGDSRSFKLCSRRHPCRHTVPLATPARAYCASGDSQSPKSASSCRRRRSLPCQLSSEAQFV